MKRRTDLLWPLVIPAALGFYVSLVPLPPNDFWWHLRIGQIIHVQRTIPTTKLVIPLRTAFWVNAHGASVPDLRGGGSLPIPPGAWR